MSLWRTLYHGETNIDFIGRRRIWFALSGVALAVCAIALAVGPSEAARCGSVWPLRGLECGIEFKGGVQLRAPVASDGPLGDASDTEVISEVRAAVAQFGAADAQIQVEQEGDERRVLLQTREIADPEGQDRLIAGVARAVGASVAETDSQRIGSKWGAEITAKARTALIVFIIVVLVFISLRFELKMAIAAVVALFHDLLITAGVYSLVGFEVTPSTVIAILTILGYSLYDTVVVFDKVEEDAELLAKAGKSTYQDAANVAMNEVFMRSLNTSMTTLLPVSTLLFVGAGLLGAQTLQDLALALFVGILAGTYSSIFVATPVLAIMKEREPRYRNVREKLLRDAKRSAPPPGPVTAAAKQEEAAPSARPGPSPARPPARTRAGSKKAKRRRRR